MNRNILIFNFNLILEIIEGPGAMLGAAVVGGLILAMIEGISLGLNRMSGSAMLQEQLSKKN